MNFDLKSLITLSQVEPKIVVPVRPFKAHFSCRSMHINYLISGVSKLSKTTGRLKLVLHDTKKRSLNIMLMAYQNLFVFLAFTVTRLAVDIPLPSPPARLICRS